MNKIKQRRGSVPIYSAFLDRVVHHLFPAHQERPVGTRLTANDGTDKPPDVNDAELITTAKRICVRKALEPHKISSLAIPLIFARPRLVPVCVRKRSRHTGRCRGWYSYLRMGNPQMSHSQLTGKLLQRIIYTRLKVAIQQTKDLPKNQFSFRKWRSTIDAVGRIVTLRSNVISGRCCTKRMCAITVLDV